MAQRRLRKDDIVRFANDPGFPDMIVVHATSGGNFVDVQWYRRHEPVKDGRHSGVTFTIAADQLMLTEAAKKKQEASHPLGASVPDQYFIWCEEFQIVGYHPIIVTASSKEEAEKIAERELRKRTLLAATIETRKEKIRAAPVREGHLRNKRISDYG